MKLTHCAVFSSLPYSPAT